MYVDIGREQDDEAKLVVSVDDTDTVARKWDIRVTQVECSSRAA